MPRVFAKDHHDFGFTPGQKKELRRELGRVRCNLKMEALHSDFLEYANIFTGVWLREISARVYYHRKFDGFDGFERFELEYCHLPQRNKVYYQELAALRKSIHSLLGCLDPIQDEVVMSLLKQARVTVSTDFPVYVQDTLLFYRDHKCNPWVEDTTRSLLVKLLELYDKAAEEVQKRKIDKGGSHNPTLVYLIEVLVDGYQQIYGKPPGVSQDTIFVRFITKIAEIFSLTVSVSLIKRIVQK